MMSKTGGMTHQLYPVLQRLSRNPESFKKKIKKSIALRGIKRRSESQRDKLKFKRRVKKSKDMDFDFLEEDRAREILSEKVRQLSHIRPEVIAATYCNFC